MKLPRKFYKKNTLKVAQDLLGKILVRKYRGKKLVGKIVETEAYIGKDDLACHASRGLTKRNRVMFGQAGFAYIYIIYGMYYCLNIVTEKEGFPAAVLIRAIEPIAGIDVMQKLRVKSLNSPDRDTKFKKRHLPIDKSLTNGPGKLCRAMSINKNLNGEGLAGEKLWIEDRSIKILKKDVIKTKRVGIDYAGRCKNYPWRFYLKNNNFVSAI